MRGVIYARYSEGPRQTDQSIEGQVRDCRAFADEKDIQIIEIYADRHISGKSVEGRDEFQRMMRDAEARRFDCIIVWKIDRFGRNREDIAVNKIRLRKAGVTLMYAKESVPEGPEGILLESLLEGLAEYYSADLRQKVVRGLDETAKKGRWPSGSLPIGYRKDADGRIAIDEERADLVRTVYRMHLAGESQQAMQQYLYDHGLTNRRGGMVAQAVVYRMLRNERYTGRFAYRDIEIPAPAIIDREVWELAQTKFRGSAQNAAGRAKVQFLLSCKCHCGYCGQTLNGETGTGKSGKAYHYYKCGKKKHGGKCILRPFPQKDLEDLVIDHTVQDVLTDELIGELTARIMEIQEKRRGEDPAAVYNKRLKENKKKQDNLVAALEAGGSRAIAARLAELEAEADQLELEIARAEVQHPLIPETMIRGWLLSFRSGDKESPAFRKKLVETFVADIIVENDQVTIFYNIENESGSKCSSTTRLVELAKSYANTDRRPFIADRWIVLRVAI